MEVLVLVAMAGVMLWLLAVVDLIRADDMDPTARIIVAAALFLFAPVGVLLWLIVRQGRLGVMLATVLLVGTAVLVAGAFSEWNFHNPFATQHVMQVEVAGSSGGAVQSAPGQP